MPNSLQSVDQSPPGSPVRGVLQARLLEWWPRFPPGDLPYVTQVVKARSIKPRFCEFDSRKGISALICWAQGYNRAHLCNVLTHRLH